MRMWERRFSNCAAGTNGTGRRGSTFRLLAFAALLAQLQLVYLAGFHYHPDFAGPRQSPLAVSAIPGQSGSPADNSGSCTFCQIVRHGVSTAATPVALLFHSISTISLAPVVVVRPIAHPQVRLAGRDPPHSFLASC
jgi:hypothetical protein